jgi:HEAT repeat protein
MTCFKVLGPRANAAIPELTWMLTNSATDEEAWKAATALAGIGSAGLPSLMAAMTNRRNRNVVRVAAAYSVGDMGSNAAAAVSALVGCLQDRDIQLAICSAMSLGRLGLQPEIAVPALANSLESSNMQHYAVGALRRFGPNARLAVPELVRMLDDPSSDVRRLASDALEQIAPEVLADRNVAERQ